MLTFDRGYWRVYERIRIDRNERVCHCRPDTSSELARTIYAYERETGNKDLHDVYENQINWLTRVQNENGDKNMLIPNQSNTLFSYTLPDGSTQTETRLSNMAHISRLNKHKRIKD